MTMKINYTFLFSFILLLIASSVWSQNDDEAITPCGANEVMDQFILDHPEMEAIIKADEQQLEAFTQQFINSKILDDTLIIPVVFHIIHMDGDENLPSEVVHDCITRLNLDFQAENDDADEVIDEFQDLIPVTNILFRLATIDPEGNCHSGITRTYSPQTLMADTETQLLIQWPREKYLNVWVVRNIASGAAAYSRYPSSVDDYPQIDGIVNRYDYLGINIRTLTHEVGHWINLRHVWGNSNNVALPENCDDDDLVSDTPLCIGNTGCPLDNFESCGSLDNIQNYMNYSSCDRNFTHGQSDRMRAALNSSVAQRNNLWTEANLAATGTNVDPTLCEAEFHADRTTVCNGEEIKYTDDSYNGEIISWNWTFEGGDPATSDVKNPIVIYPQAGNYDVTLTVSTSVDEKSTVKSNFIKVLTSGVETPYSESFETTTSFPNDEWFISPGDDDINWEITDAAAAESSRSAYLQNIDQSNDETDQLIYSTVDLSSLDAAEISFKFAYAKRHEDDTDELRLGVSRDCGDSWTIYKRLKASNGSLITAEDQSGDFIPSIDEWGEQVVTLSILYHIEGFRFLFEFENGGGNNVYIDDIKIYDPTAVGINEVNKAALNYNVYPNPVNDQLNVEFNLLENTHVLGEIFDVTGRKVTTMFNSNYSLGTHRLDYNTSDLNSGVYFVKITLEGESFTKRIIKN